MAAAPGAFSGHPRRGNEIRGRRALGQKHDRPLWWIGGRLAASIFIILSGDNDIDLADTLKLWGVLYRDCDASILFRPERFPWGRGRVTITDYATSTVLSSIEYNRF